MFAVPLVYPDQDFLRHLPTVTTDSQEGIATEGQAGAAPRRQNASTHPTSTIAALKHDEALIDQRKVAIARFGATWIRPPGVTKTLQAETEEKLEREEAEILARREQLMLDMQAQQEAEEARQRAAATEAMDEMEGEEEHDLDDDVPEGSTLGMDVDLSAEEEAALSMDDGTVSDEEGTTEADMTFNDGSMIEGSMLHPGMGDEENSAVQELEEQERYAQLQEAELTGATQEEYDLGMDANLDDSIPEAGSYEHTDTELEDDDSDSDDEEPSLPAMRPPSGTSIFDARRSLGTRLSSGSAGSRASLSGRDVSSLLESSFITSSPMMPRGRPFPPRNTRPR